MPVVGPVTSSPIARIGQITHSLDGLALQRGMMENNLILGALGFPSRGKFSFLGLVQNSYITGLLRTFFSYWIDEIKRFYEMIKKIFGLADPAK